MARKDGAARGRRGAWYGMAGIIIIIEKRKYGKSLNIMAGINIVKGNNEK